MGFKRSLWKLLGFGRTPLKPVDDFAGGIVVQACRGPTLRDRFHNGRTYVCGHCGNIVATGIADDQVWDLAVECGRCGRLSTFPALPARMVLPPKYVFMAPRRHLFEETQHMRGSVMTGDPTARPRPHVATNKNPKPLREIPPKRKAVNPALLRGYVTNLKGLMGCKFDILLDSDKRIVASATPPKHRHPLMEIVDEVGKSIESFKTASPWVDARHVSELMALFETLDTWKGHPGWEDFTLGLANEYDHTVITLATARRLRSQGNAVALLKGDKGRAADLRIIVGAQRYADVEVKAPRELRWRTANLTADAALTLVTSAAKRAGTGKKGQLPQRHPGVLAIGGFHLSDADLDSLETAAREYLRRHSLAGRHAHIMAVAIVSLGSTITSYADVQDRELRSQVVLRLAANPGYANFIELDDSPFES